jgi:hypothetical protein
MQTINQLRGRFDLLAQLRQLIGLCRLKPMP